MAVAFEMGDIDTYTIGATEAELTLEAMYHRLEHMHDPLAGIIRDMEHHTLAQFETRGGVSGELWAALDPSTVREKMGYPDPEWPLVRTGALLESATSPVGPFSEGETLDSEAWMGVDWERDGYQIPVLHQEGVPWRLVTQHRHRKDGSAYTVTYRWHLPSRPIFTITDDLVDEGAERIVAHVFNPLA